MIDIKSIIERFKNWLNPPKKKKTYVQEMPDYASGAVWFLASCIGIYLVARAVFSDKVALPLMLVIPAFIGMIGILFIVPIRILMFVLAEITLRVLEFHSPRNKPEETVVVIGKSDYFKPSYWISPNYGTELILILDYLRMVGKPFSVYFNADVNILDTIMGNKNIRTVYLVGHGRRHGFGIDDKMVVDYCRYDAKKYQKDYVYQIHCNHGSGKSLVQYVVLQQNQDGCMPEHGYMSNITISQMFVDKIIAFKHLAGIDETILRAWYGVVTNGIPIVSIAIWVFIFWRMVG